MSVIYGDAMICQLQPHADTSGTQRVGSITMPPKDLVDTFGPPLPGDGYKVSGQYTFVSDSGETFTLYDFKCTSLYDDGMEPGEESSFPTPDDFWGNWNPETLTIAAQDGGFLEEFKEWLRLATT